MTSIAIKGSRYLVKPEEADKYGPFNRTFLAEGDSWMDASAWNQGSLPEFLAREYNRLARTNLIVNIATSGQTLTHIVDMMTDDLVWWLNQQTYDGILLSAGGNDFIDAAKDAPPGLGLLHDLRGKPMPASGYDCVRQDALTALVDYLNQNFEAIYQAIRRSNKNADTPIYLNSYDTPVARNAPAFKNFCGPWLYTAYTKNGIDPSLWTGLTEGMFADIKRTISAWAVGRSAVIVVATTGLLAKADPGSDGESTDWVNEIHPNKSGWRKQVPAWLDVLPA